MSTRNLRPPKVTSRQSNEIARIALRYGRSEWCICLDGTCVLSCWGDDPGLSSAPMIFHMDQRGFIVYREGPNRPPAVPEREE